VADPLVGARVSAVPAPTPGFRADLEVVALLRALVAGQRAILAALEEFRTCMSEIRADARQETRPCVAGFRDADALLPVLAAAVGDHVFSAREVVAHARVNPELADTLTAARLSSARKLGRYLQRVEGREAAGVRVRKIGADRDGAIWQCEPGS
jgi:hypothetical protein